MAKVYLTITEENRPNLAGVIEILKLITLEVDESKVKDKNIEKYFKK